LFGDIGKLAQADIPRFGVSAPQVVTMPVRM